MRHLQLALAVAVAAGCACAAGCGGPANPAPAVITIVPIMEMLDLSLVAIADGDKVALNRPDQGGQVLYIGAQVTNLLDTYAEVDAKLRSATDNSIVAEDARTADFMLSPTDANTWIPKHTDFSNVANVPVCPDYSAQPYYGGNFVLEVTVTDTVTMATASVTRKVVPSCEQTDPMLLALCQCECAANYVLGNCGSP